MTDKLSLGALTALDWIAVALAGLVCLLLLAFPFLVSPAYLAMFEDFGAKATLPGMTQLVIQTWFPLVGLLVVVGLLALSLFGRLSLGKRRALIVVGFVLAVLWSGACWLGLYLPIFELAGAVQA